MRLHVISAASEPGGTAPNEDRFGVDPDAGVAWVLDAATSTAPPRISPNQTDGAWFADRIERALGALIEFELTHSPAELIDQAGLAARVWLEHLGHDPEDRPPYASIAVVRLEDETLHWALLGDVVLAVHRPDGTTDVLRDNRSERFVQMAIDLAYRYTGEELRAEQHAFEDRYVNTPAGYPILNTSAARSSAILDGATPVERGTRVLMATDGLARLVDLFCQPPDYTSLLALLGPDAQGVEHAVQRLRALEATDENREIYRRIKKSDDATGVLVAAE
jgi:hypothetical protein